MSTMSTMTATETGTPNLPTLQHPPETKHDRKSLLRLIMRRFLIFAVEWAELATLDLSVFGQPGGKAKLAKQLHNAIQNVGQ